VQNAAVSLEFLARFQVKRGRPATKLAEFHPEQPGEGDLLEGFADAPLFFGREPVVFGHER
jgi:hypothetical protein